MSSSQRSLQDEVVQLRALLDHHPEVMRVAVENGNLKGDTDQQVVTDGIIVSSL